MRRDFVMRSRFSSYLGIFALVIGVYIVVPATLNAQDEVLSKEIKEKIKEVEKIHKDVVVKDKYKEFCSNNNWNNGEKVSSNELRELNVASTGRLEVDGARNGGISVRGENRSDILVRACVQAWGSSEQEAKSLASSVRVNTGGVIKADGPDDNYGKINWSVSYEIIAPRNSNLTLRAQNGGISVKSIDGDMDLNTVNGGVSVADAAGSVKGRTTNGGLSVRLVGSGWKGSGLDLQTTNGGVSLMLPANFAANVEAGTVNGGFSSDFPGLQVEKQTDHQYGPQPKKVAASINGGGAPVRVVTMNGGIRISSSESKY
jgi:hypothetical protein